MTDKDEVDTMVKKIGCEIMHYDCLIVDDEIPLAQSTAEYFNLFGVNSSAVFDADACIEFLKFNTVDLILLDINLGETSGFDLCQSLRKQTQIPILFINARQSDDDILLALHIGGDDYIRKPYSLNVLLAKVKVTLKRYGTKKIDFYEYQHLYIDYSAQKVSIHGQPIQLKSLEYKLLCYLIENRNKVVSKEDIFNHVWGDHFTSDGTLNVHIRHLREKIEEAPDSPTLIRTVWGIGYSFNEQSS